MDIVTTIALIGALATAAAAGLASLPWREAELEATTRAFRSLEDLALGGATMARPQEL